MLTTLNNQNIDNNSQWILGINPSGFNTSSVLLNQNRIVSAIEEERINREKRTRSFPSSSINYQLQTAGLELEDLSAIAISWNPAINLKSLNAAHSSRPRFLGELLFSAANHLLPQFAPFDSDITKQTIFMGNKKSLATYFVRHHHCHAASFYLSPFDKSAVLTVDAFGEDQTTTFSTGTPGGISTLWSQAFPHSLGAFYSTFTEFLGFAPQSDEWKLMGASSFGDPSRFRSSLSRLYKLNTGVGFELNLNFFDFYNFHRLGRFTKNLVDLLGLEPLPLGGELTQAHYDLAAGAQEAFEEIYLGLLNQLHKISSEENIVISGGCALNSVANGKIHQRTPFQASFIPPTPDDSGGALGAALVVIHETLGFRSRIPFNHNYLGPEFSDSQILHTLNSYKLRYKRLQDPQRTAAELISSGEIVGWFQGALEFGDRALGNRSILADPRNPEMKNIVNDTVKYRENFRPFAPAVLAERFGDFFCPEATSQYMERVVMVRKDKKALIPAVTHIDGTARVQTVTASQNPRFYKLLQELEIITGIPVVLNTSFNVQGEPIVCSPSDALRTFFASGLDALILGSYLVKKQDDRSID